MTAAGVSEKQAMVKSVTNIIGARKKIVLNGLDVDGWRRSRICVRPHRKPEKKLAEMARVKPRAWKAVSPKTIIKTPTVMLRMMRMSFQEGVSRRKIKANIKTKMRTLDLHIV